MSFLLDTAIVIHLRDGDPVVRDRLSAALLPVFISAITLVELEGGIDETDANLRRERLIVALKPLMILTFGQDQSDAYGYIVRCLGYSRRKVLDRMIAAQALVANVTLVTRNVSDFREIPDLKLTEW